MTANATARPVPVTDDADTGGFWQAAAEGRLAICVCGSCGSVLHLPRAYCATCGSWNAIWRDVSGRGSLYSWSIIEHQVHAAFPAPYALVLVELDDLADVRLVGQIPGRPELSIGVAMEVHFEDLGAGVWLPQWRVIKEG